MILNFINHIFKNILQWVYDKIFIIISITAKKSSTFIFFLNRRLYMDKGRKQYKSTIFDGILTDIKLFFIQDEHLAFLKNFRVFNYK